MNFAQTESAETKLAVHRALIDKLGHELKLLREDLQSLQESANEETKSSAGDKYETGRAMAQLEMEKLNGLVAEKLNLLQILAQVKTNSSSERIHFGSIIETNIGNFYLTVNGGEIIVASKKFMVLSPASPLGKLLLDKVSGNSFTINGRKVEIKNFF